MQRKATLAHFYNVLGVSISISSDVPDIVERIDETYAAFRCEPWPAPPAVTLHMCHAGAEPGYVVRDGRAYQQWWADRQDALLDMMDRLVRALLGELHRRGLYAVHAGAVAHDGGALILAGRSNYGKTTLTLGLLERGAKLLSDEFAVIEPRTSNVLPYRRSLHIRPPTPSLIPELGFLEALRRNELGGGNVWTVAPAQIQNAFPGCLGGAAPLRYVLLLDGEPRRAGPAEITPLPSAQAAIELLRGTWAASADFTGTLRAISTTLTGAACARLQPGALQPTLDAITSWIEGRHD